MPRNANRPADSELSAWSTRLGVIRDMLEYDHP